MSSTDHGGAREGAGRPLKYGEPVEPIKVPRSQVKVIFEFLDSFRERRALEDDGVRATQPRRAQPGRRVQIPLMGYLVPAGFPSPADDYVEETLDFNAHLIRRGHEDSTFVVRSSGWSMIGAGIHDQDEVVCDRAIVPEHNMVVVAVVSGDLVIKRLKLRGKKVALVSDNPHYPERTIVEGDDLQIWGVATRVLHPLP
jgi:DNA polymerase V